MSSYIMAQNFEDLNISDCESVVKRTKCFIIDCDGVLWNVSSAIPGAIEVVNKMKSVGKTVLLVTNNSTKTREQYLEKCRKMGFKVDIDEIICTAYVTSQYLKNTIKLPADSKVYVIGSEALCEEIRNAGLNHLPPGPDNVNEDETMETWAHTPLEDNVRAVIVGFDQFISYHKILKAASYLNNPSCVYIATNEDPVFPFEGSRCRIPGTGSMVSSVNTVSGRLPTVMGKPHERLNSVLKQQMPPAIKDDEVMVIGDRLDSDIQLAYNCRYRSLAVLTGITSVSEISEVRGRAETELASRRLLPDYYAMSIATLLPHLE